MLCADCAALRLLAAVPTYYIATCARIPRVGADPRQPFRRAAGVVLAWCSAGAVRVAVLCGCGLAALASASPAGVLHLFVRPCVPARAFVCVRALVHTRTYMQLLPVMHKAHDTPVLHRAAALPLPGVPGGVGGTLCPGGVIPKTWYWYFSSIIYIYLSTPAQHPCRIKFF